MNKNRILKIDGTLIDKEQLKMHLQKIASNHNLCKTSSKDTYPIYQLEENYKFILNVYNVLNEHLKLGITIHPAGEWLLDNIYIIEESVKVILKDMTLKKYKELPGIENGIYKGFSRIYILAAEIIAYVDNKIDSKELEEYMSAYQSKKNLSMEEIWNIALFLQICIIQKIREICEKIYISQMEKYKAENIVERLVESKDEVKFSLRGKNSEKYLNIDIKYPFIEYMSYILKRYGKRGNSYLYALEDVVEMAGTNISEIIKKEHFDMALRKVSIGNAIVSIKKIQRINFLDIFEKINSVEEILKKDPAKVYEFMDNRSKESYRNKIKEISKKVKVSEIYVVNKMLELAKREESGTKKSHIGYYITQNGVNQLYKCLNVKTKKEMSNINKSNIYITSIILNTILISSIISLLIYSQINNIVIASIIFLTFLIPSYELISNILRYILSKCISPKIIYKLDYSEGLPESSKTMVVIPTILDSIKKVEEMVGKLEIAYLSNKSKNIYFTLLGDVIQSEKEEIELDIEIINKMEQLVRDLNNKYKNVRVDLEENDVVSIPIFNYIYRKREWNAKESSYIGWERKRGMISLFNKYLLGKIESPFRVNSFENSKSERELKEKLKEIKYIITLDSDTDLILTTAFELVGSMDHILNIPIIDEKKNIVIDGYGIIQPRVGVNLEVTFKSLFTKIYANDSGVNLYSNAISDVYQDNFEEGIFTGKGIYNLRIFEKVLEKEIPENTVLSHDLLEGNYLRCGLATDIVLMDGYPSKYNSYINRLSRWIRGDWQLLKWFNSKLSKLSKFKIFDNMIRSLVEIFIILNFISIILIGLTYNINLGYINVILLSILSIASILEVIDKIFFNKKDEYNTKVFAYKITGIKGVLYKFSITLGCIPFKAYITLKAIIKTIYRMYISKKNLLEWMTSEEAEKQSKSSLVSYFNMMWINELFGISIIGISIINLNVICIMLGIFWIIMPSVMWKLSKELKEGKPFELITKKEQIYILDIAKRTWKFFEEYLVKENNYLIPDNYQENRRNKIVDRTSSTNIGLSMLSVISAFDLKYIERYKAIEYIINILDTIEDLQKWNGHLYNWYNIKTKEPLYPRYISTVDSGNFVGYLYVVKSFLEENVQGKENIYQYIELIDKLIANTDFSLLIKSETQIFSIGFNVEENKLTDSYYDLLASEARQASIVAIAKKDVSVKNWQSLSRTLTVVDKYKGLISWSGTAFEYLMPNVIMPTYKGSILDESSKFLIKSQMEYCKKLEIPWGISESAFNLKDLQSNYQYKAFGIPWLGLKRGLADEKVISPYGSILGINIVPKEEIYNLKVLEKYGMIGNYGFYEAIDFTPERVEKGNKFEIIKTYMAHHQALNILSINNFCNDNILQKRFLSNKEIKAVMILLQESMPTKGIITKEKKEKVEKIKYVDYNGYCIKTHNKIDERLVTGNVISNQNYTIAINQKGEGFSKYKDIYINRYKKTDDYAQGIFFAIKDVKNKDIWTSSYATNDCSRYNIDFMPDKVKQEVVNNNIKSKIETTIASEEGTEIRRLTLNNENQEEITLEVTIYFEPILSKREEDYAHRAFNNLFLTANYEEETNSLMVKRKNREENIKEMRMMINLSTNSEVVGELEYEIDSEKFLGRGNIGLPVMIKNSIPFSRKIGLVTEPIIALKRTVKIKAKGESYVDLIISVGEHEEVLKENIKKYKIKENVQKDFDIAKARVEAESRYLGVKGEDIEIYQKILSYIIFDNSPKSNMENQVDKKIYKQEKLWKYGISGDLPVILVKIRNVNDGYIVEEILKAYEFFRSKNIECEVVIIDQEKYSYENYVRDEIENNILNNNLGFLKNIKGGIFTLSKGEIDLEDIKVLEFIATLIIDSKNGGIENNIKEIEEKYLKKNIGEISKEVIEVNDTEEDWQDYNILENKTELKYYNEYGAFSSDGKEYLIKVDKENRLPTVWCNILANKKFGCILTESMGGYTWYKNSKLNRVSSWGNNPVFDIPSEIIYIKDLETKKAWSLGLNPMPDDKNYNIVYGFGYIKYIHKSDGMEQILEIFVPREDSSKIQILKLKNLTPAKKKLKIFYYLKPVIGDDELKTNGNINLEYDKNNNILIAKNLYKNDGEEYSVYVSNSENIKSYTGDKQVFLGRGGISDPEGLKRNSLGNENSIFKNNCIAYEIEVEIEPEETKEIVYILGAEEEKLECMNIAYKYSKLQNSKLELQEVKNYWKEKLEQIQVYTPIESINILLNGWVVYQVLVSRLLGRTGYYQSGGAFGFRDQLQDTFGLKYIDPNLLKNQIVKHSKHQFIEGDVEHWWHDETKRGIRTRFSDDLLWLPYAVIEYIEFTGDYTILDIETPYKIGEMLEEGIDERYDRYEETDFKEPIYNHLIKAIEKSLRFGKNGIPLIGSGDWNDGMSTVGNKGIGESVWLGFFLYDILNRIIEICKYKNDDENIKKYQNIKTELKKALNNNCWDGRWYKRAFMDDGKVLGSIQNEECRIDSIAQSWSVISNAGDNDKKYIALENLENHLIDKEHAIIKLLDPPFEKSTLEPGYIKAYLPGVRENGGQYTHAAIWVVISNAMLGYGDKSLELFKMINPIEHSRTKEETKKYKVEPYVIPADIYASQNLIGRGGWTWYTGSGSWYYKAGIETILGIKIEKKYLIIEPTIPKDWKEYQVKYKYGNSIYNINIKNENGRNKLVFNEIDKTKNSKVYLNNILVENKIKLLDENKIYNIDVIM